MESFNVNYTQPGKQIIAMVVIPVTVMFLFVGILLNIPGENPDWLIVGTIVIAMAIATTLTLIVNFRYLIVPCKLDLDSKGLRITLTRKSPLLTFHEFSCGWENVTNASPEYLSQNETWYYLMKFRKPARTIQLNLPGKEAKIENPPFFLAIDRYIKEFNENPNRVSAGQITHKGFYQSRFAQFLTGLTLAMMIAAPVVALTSKKSDQSWWPLVSFYAFGITWLVNFFIARKKRQPEKE